MLKLISASFKLLIRNRMAFFWGLMFPMIFTLTFGFFFGNERVNVGTVNLINSSETEISNSLDTALTDSELFTLEKITDEAVAREKLKRGDIVALIIIPERFGELAPEAPKFVNVVYDPANAQANTAVLQLLRGYFTQLEFTANHLQPTFGITEEKTTANELNYFDFVWIGLIGMALMNSSIQGVAIAMANYREEQILKRLTTTPLRPWKFIFSESLARLFMNAVQIALILAVGYWGFHGHLYGNLAIIYLVGLLGALLFQSIGFAVASISKTTQSAQQLSIITTIPMMFLAGVFFPIDQLPSWLQMIVQYLPLAPLLRILRGVSLENASIIANPTNLIIVAVWIIAMLVIAANKFRLTDE